MLDHMVTPFLLFEEMPDYFYKELVPLCTPLPPFIFKFPFWTTTPSQTGTAMIFTCQGLSFPMECSTQPALGLLPLPWGNHHIPSEGRCSKRQVWFPSHRFLRSPGAMHSSLRRTLCAGMLVTVGMLVPWYTHGGQRTNVWSQFLLPFLWHSISLVSAVCSRLQPSFQPVLPASHLTLAVLGGWKHTIALAFNRDSGVQTQVIKFAPQVLLSFELYPWPQTERLIHFLYRFAW